MRILSIILASLLSVLAWVGQVGPDQAMSNYAAWYEVITTFDAPPWMETTAVDFWGTRIFGIAAFACFVWFFWPWIVSVRAGLGSAQKLPSDTATRVGDRNGGYRYVSPFEGKAVAEKPADPPPSTSQSSCRVTPLRLTEYEREQRLRALDEIFECLRTEVTPAYISGHRLNAEWISELRANGPPALADRIEDFRIMADTACGKLSELVVEKYGFLPDLKRDIEWSVPKLNENSRILIQKLNQLGEGDTRAFVELLRDHDVLKNWWNSVLALSGMIEKDRAIIAEKRKVITDSWPPEPTHQEWTYQEFDGRVWRYSEIAALPIPEREKLKEHKPDVWDAYWRETCRRSEYTTTDEKTWTPEKVSALPSEEQTWLLVSDPDFAEWMSRYLDSEERGDEAISIFDPKE